MFIYLSVEDDLALIDSRWNPKISIVIPVFNGGDHFKQALRSALAQTYPHFEVIVVNDGSTDDGETERIARSFGDKIRYFSKENGGVASALNLGIANMQGEYMSWLSHDDIYHPEKLEKQVKILNLLSKDLILYSDFSIIDNNSIETGAQKVFYNNPKRLRLNLICYPQVHGCTTLIPKECFDKIGTFNESLKHTQDYDFYLRASKKYYFFHIPSSLISARHHAGQTSKVVREERNFELALFFNEFLKEYMNDSSHFYAIYPEISFNLIRTTGFKYYGVLEETLKKKMANEPNLVAKVLAYSRLSKSALIALIILPLKYCFNKFNKKSKYADNFNDVSQSALFVSIKNDAR